MFAKNTFFHIFSALLIAVFLLLPASPIYAAPDDIASDAAVSSNMYGGKANFLDDFSVVPARQSGGWTRTNALLTGREGLAVAATRHYIYALGGINGTTKLSGIERASINADGTLSPWQDSGSLPAVRQAARAVAVNRYLYVVGGDDDSGPVSTVFYAHIKADGSLGLWNTTNSLLTGRANFALVAANNFLYALGGVDASGNTIPNVEYASIQPDGTLGAWQTTSPLASARRGLDATFVNGYIYSIAGHNDSGKLATTEYAEVLPDGTLGKWQTATAELASARTYFAVETDGPHIYAFGGADQINNGISSVEMTTVQADHSLGDWQAYDNLTEDKFALDAVNVGGYIYVLGGHSWGSSLTTVEYSWSGVRAKIIKSIAAQDGWIRESSQDSDRGGMVNSVSAALRLGDSQSRKQYLSILSFRTKPLPDNAIITRVELKVKKQGTDEDDLVKTFQGFMVDVKQGAFGKTKLQARDFQAEADKTCGPFMAMLNDGWYSLDLTAAKNYINNSSTASSLTQIRLRFKLDDNNNAVANYLSLYSGNATTAADRPQLIIEYYVP